VTDAVLVTDVGRDVMKNLRQFALEARGVLPSAGQLGEGFELILVLQPPNASTERIVAPTGRFRAFSRLPSNADGIDGNVFGGLDLLQDLIQIQLAERIVSRRNQNDVFFAVDAVAAVDSVVNGVEEVALLESRH